MLAQDNETFRTPGENRTCDAPNTIKIGRSNHWTGVSQVRFSPGAWKFPLSRASMVSPPSKLKMFIGNVCVLLTSVSLKSSFRSPAEKNKQEWEHSSVWLFSKFSVLLIKLLFFLLVQVDPSPLLFYFYFFIQSESIRVGPSWSDPDRQSELIRSDVCTCLSNKGTLKPPSWFFTIFLSFITATVVWKHYIKYLPDSNAVYSDAAV